MEKYRFLQHTADMKFLAYGKNIEECFVNASYALREIITKDKIKPLIKKTIKIKGKDNESLLYNFLEEFLFLIDSDNFILSKIIKIKVDKDEFKINAEIIGDNIKKYKTITDIKAITYNDMFVKINKDKVTCQVVVDV
jgi:SHS2 domain-containing protein